MRRVLLFSVVVTVIVLLLPFGSTAVCDGYFPLSVVLADTGDIDTATLQFATCWSDVEAVHATETGTNGEIRFREAEKSNKNTFTVAVPWSGRVRCFGNLQSYNHPIWLVVQYGASDPEAAPRRARFRIPAGRGPRVMRIDVP